MRSTSRRSASARSTTSPTARSPGARWPRGTSPRRSAGASSRRRSCATARSGRAWSRRSSRPTPTVDVVAMVVEDDERLRRMAVLDAVMNNTDRKGGHILPVDGGRHIYGVDHGVTASRPCRSCGRCSGAGAGCRSRPTRSQDSSGSATALDGDLGATLAGLLSRARGACHGTSHGGAARGRAFPVSLAGLARDPLAAVLIAVDA